MTGPQANPLAVHREVAPDWAAMVGLHDASAATASKVVLATPEHAATNLEPGPPPSRAEHAPLSTDAGAGGQRGQQADRDGGDAAQPSTAVAKERAGAKALLRPSDVAYRRLPMLEGVLDRLAGLLTTSIGVFIAASVDARVAEISARRFGDLPSAAPAMLAVFRAIPWDGHGLLGIDSALIYTLIDRLLGGRRRTAARIEGQACTTIEAALAERLIRLVLDELGRAFAPLAPVRFDLERIETDRRRVAIARPEHACWVNRLQIDLEGGGGALELVMPHATLEPVLEVLLQPSLGERFGHDPDWANHLAHEIQRASIEVEARLGERVVSLKDMVGLEVGSIIRLDARMDAPVHLICGPVRIATGRVGRTGDRMVIGIEALASGAQEDDHG
jgi:flagellar motor switch protein FliM